MYGVLRSVTSSHRPHLFITTMELRRLGDSLLRKQSFLMFQYHAPSVSCKSMYAITNPSYDTIPGLSISRRPFTSYSPILQAYYSATAAVASSNSDPRPASDKDSHERSEVRTLLDESLPSRYNSSDPNARPNLTPRSYVKTVPFSSTFNVVSSSDAMETHYRTKKPSYQGSIADNMHFTKAGDASKDIVENVTTVFKPRAVRTIKSRPSVGRTVEINSERGQDLSRALRKLEMQCNANNVRRDQLKQRFHERPGLKRKRLARERWRSRFKEGFYAVLCKVRAMRKKGW